MNAMDSMMHTILNAAPFNRLLFPCRLEVGRRSMYLLLATCSYLNMCHKAIGLIITGFFGRINFFSRQPRTNKVVEEDLPVPWEIPA